MSSKLPRYLTVGIQITFLSLIFSVFGWAQTPPPVSFAARNDFPAGANDYSAASEDLNGDKIPDVVITNGSANTVSVLLGNGNGTLKPGVTYTVGSGPSAVAIGDFNGDGIPDLIVVNQTGNSLSVLLGNGDGTFQNQIVTGLTSGQNPSAIAIGDFNGDKKIDVAVLLSEPAQGSYAIAVLLGKGDGTFQGATNYSSGLQPSAIRAADFNGDGKLDLVTLNFSNGGEVSVYLGNGDGTFDAPSNTAVATSYSNIVVGDFNTDGKLDVAVQGFVLLGNGDGTFQPPIQIFAGPVNVTGDFNGDGIPDLAASNGAVTTVLLGNDAGGFGQITNFTAPAQALIAGTFGSDSRVDLVAVGLPNGGSLGVASVIMGRGDGTFLTDTAIPVKITGEVNTTIAVATGDFNHDGHPDTAALLQVKNDLDAVAILLGSGNGVFQSPILTRIQTTSAVSVTAADVNNDGKLDLVVGDSDGSFIVLLGNGDGTFQPGVSHPGGGTSIVVADLNHDGKLDIAAGNAGSKNINVSLGNGNGTFGSPTTYPLANPLSGLTTADFNEDGIPDLAAAAGSSVEVLLGNGNGTFGSAIETTLTAPVNSITAADFNGDRKADVAVASPCASTSVCSFGTASILLGNGDGTFQSPTVINVGYQPSGITAADLNGDSKPDLAVLNSGWNDFSILVGNGDGTFEPPVNFGTDPVVGKSTIADLNGDGTPDIVVGTTAGLSYLWNRPSGASAVLSANSLVFAPQVVNLTSPLQTVTLNNLGRTDLTISGVTVIGAQATAYTQTNNCGSSILAGSECAIQVTLTPATVGTQSATLQITDDSPNSPQLVALSGSSVAGTIRLIPPSGGSSATVAAGSATVYVLGIGGGGFSGVVNMTCTGAPTGATCSVPASVDVSATNVNDVSVNVTTTARTSAGLKPVQKEPLRWFWATAVLGLVGIPLRNRERRKRYQRYAWVLPVVLVMFISSCGGSSNSSSNNGGSQTNPNGTPAGTYPLTVTATSGTTQESIILSLVVE